jgi:hypothetical protein
MSRLQQKPPAHKRGHPTLQNMNFFYFCGSFFALLDPDPDPYSNYGSGSGSTLPIEYGSNTDPDPDPQPWFFFHISSSFFTLDLGSAWDPGLTSRIIFIRAFY